ncbi:MAG TPA: FtsX-like permease family protein [bacterium]|nr:FtsX-like permease family protein [bacterium]HQO35142.1 FtsX-like permease family protein [bacterium]HQQ00699.1 FtsX-like permease family protein [bacterium]
MSTLLLILKEIAHRKFNFILSLLAVVTAVAIYIAFFTSAQDSQRETTRLMRDIGYNLRIIPKETDMIKFWEMGFSDSTMPEDYILRFAEKTQGEIQYRHLLATLHQKVTWQGMEVLLTGIAAKEVVPKGVAESSMAPFAVEPGKVYLGYELVQKAAVKNGDTVDLFGRQFQVASCLPETGSDDDIRIYGHLKDIQSIVNLHDRINEIQALECLCKEPGDPLERLRGQLETFLPEGKVIQLKAISDARREQRFMLERFFERLLPLVLVGCAIWIGALAFLNVRERRFEVGVLRALGYGSFRIAALFLGKAVIIGLIGAAIGFLLGTGFALIFGPEIFKVTAKAIRPIYFLLNWSLLIAPAFAALSSFIPTVIAVTQDPAITLREE